MNVVITFDSTFPALHYGGTERVIWGLGKALSQGGHPVTYLVGHKGGDCPFANILQYRPDVPLWKQIPEDTDLVHFNGAAFDTEGLRVPYVVTIHGNEPSLPLDANSIFVSRNHAQRYGSDSFVHNGLDWDTVGPMNLSQQRSGYHFLGKAAWSVKNVRGAIHVACRLPHGKLTVLGGTRLNLKMGFRLTLSPRVRFLGMVDDATKYAVMQQSQGLIFPVTWHEPFGLAVIESMYAGAPVFATPYGSLPELVCDSRLGFLSASASEMVALLSDAPTYDPRVCHEYARDKFSSQVMAQAYLTKYEQVLNGKVLNAHFGTRQTVYRNLPWNK